MSNAQIHFTYCVPLFLENFDFCRYLSFSKEMLTINQQQMSIYLYIGIVEAYSDLLGTAKVCWSLARYDV